jgi:hypothetical protein
MRVQTFRHSLRDTFFLSPFVGNCKTTAATAAVAVAGEVAMQLQEQWRQNQRL